MASDAIKLPMPKDGTLSRADLAYGLAAVPSALVVIICAMGWYRLDIVYHIDRAADLQLNLSAAPHSISIFSGIANAAWLVVIPAGGMMTVALCVYLMVLRHTGLPNRGPAAWRISLIASATTLVGELAAFRYRPLNGARADELGQFHQVGTWVTSRESAPIAALVLTAVSLGLLLLAVVLERDQPES
jgi:hypothetical protein